MKRSTAKVTWVVQNICRVRSLAPCLHYGDVIMGTIASQITSFTIVYSTVYSDADQRKHQSSASQAFVREIHRGPVNSPHKWTVTRKMFPFDDVIMIWQIHFIFCKNIADEVTTTKLKAHSNEISHGQFIWNSLWNCRWVHRQVIFHMNLTRTFHIKFQMRTFTKCYE